MSKTRTTATEVVPIQERVVTDSGTAVPPPEAPAYNPIAEELQRGQEAVRQALAEKFAALAATPPVNRVQLEETNNMMEFRKMLREEEERARARGRTPQEDRIEEAMRKSSGPAYLSYGTVAQINPKPGTDPIVVEAMELFNRLLHSGNIDYNSPVHLSLKAFLPRFREYVEGGKPDA